MVGVMRPASQHAISVPSLVAELIKSIKPNEHGRFLPSAKDPSKPVSHNTLQGFTWRQRDRGIIPVVTNRDLRHIWKTLAGKAGLSKEIRDRIQSHALTLDRRAMTQLVDDALSD